MNIEALQKILHEQRTLLSTQGIASMAIFGSCVRAETTLESDIDILVKSNQHVGIYKSVRLQFELAKLLGKES